jgi:hypothetical protein
MAPKVLRLQTALNRNDVPAHLGGCRLRVHAHDGRPTAPLRAHPRLTALEIDPGPTPTQHRMSLALLNAIRTENIQTGADVVALYNGIDVGEDKSEIESLSVSHPGAHLERLSTQELRRLDTQVPLDTLRAVVDVATEIGGEGPQGKPVGTIFVVRDSRMPNDLAS